MRKDDNREKRRDNKSDNKTGEMIKQNNEKKK